MAYNTGNPVEPNGSSDPRDLRDNAQILDQLVNGSSLTWHGRLGKIIKTWAGMISDFTEMMSSFGYEPNHLTYVVGQPLQVDRTTQLIDYNGGVYRAKMPVAFPLTLTGTWATDSSKLVDVGDQPLRTQLAAPGGAMNMVGGSLFKGEASDPGDTAPGTTVTRLISHAYYPEKAGALRVGGSDLEPLNDERGYFRGLPSPNAWGSPLNIGLFSTSFNRNGASYGAYSNTWGHDCATYGTASGAGGAGSATGNPDTPNDPFAGYCSWTWGKNNLAAGQKCAALGEENIINTRAAMGFGYNNTLQPSAATPDPVGASAIGRGNNVTGQGHAFGDLNSVADGIVIGDRLLGAPDEVTLGYQSLALRLQKPGTAGGRGKLGINRTKSLDHEINMDLGGGQSLAITSDSLAGSKIKLQGVKTDGSSQPIVDIVWSNPNSGSSVGELNISMNGRSTVAFSLKEDGTPVFGELKAAGQLNYPVKGALYEDGGFIKVIP